jgi:H2-forming N5,N10-methylenetetrahydromethanopterin dehydrogenase-like enzyme
MQPIANPRANVSARRRGETPWFSQKMALRFADAGISLIVLRKPIAVFPSKLSTLRIVFRFVPMKTFIGEPDC